MCFLVGIVGGIRGWAGCGPGNLCGMRKCGDITSGCFFQHLVVLPHVRILCLMQQTFTASSDV